MRDKIMSKIFDVMMGSLMIAGICIGASATVAVPVLIFKWMTRMVCS